MQQKTAKILSYLFHPLLMPTLGMLYLLNSGSYISFMEFQAKKYIISLIALFTILLPLMVVPYYIYQKLIKNVEISKRRDRVLPFFTTTIFYIAAYVLLSRWPVPSVLKGFMLGAAVSSLLTAFITLKWKISAHMIGMGGLTGLIVASMFLLEIPIEYFLMVSLFISGLAGTSRLLLKEHSPSQVYVGYFTGMVCVFVTTILSL